MIMRKSDFVEDRDFNFDAPGDDASLREKIEHQRRLNKACEECPPIDMPWVAMDEARWWCIPFNPSP